MKRGLRPRPKGIIMKIVAKKTEEEDKTSMKMRSFGKLGIQGSAFGLGCMRFPMVEKDGKKVVDEENAIRIIRTAIDGGVTYLDTAYVYLGQQSEVVVGKALQDGYREKVTIATKLPTWLVERGAR